MLVEKEKQYLNKAKGADRLLEARESVLIPVEAKYWNRLEHYRQGREEDLVRGEDKESFFDGCPICNTDEYLMNISPKIQFTPVDSNLTSIYGLLFCVTRTSVVVLV